MNAFCIGLTMAAFYRAPARNVNRTVQVRGCPLLHVGP